MKELLRQKRAEKDEHEQRESVQVRCTAGRSDQEKGERTSLLVKVSEANTAAGSTV